VSDQPSAVTDEMVERLARYHFTRAHPYAKPDTWDWLPAGSRRQWLEDARADLYIALGESTE